MSLYFDNKFININEQYAQELKQKLISDHIQKIIQYGAAFYLGGLVGGVSGALTGGAIGAHFGGVGMGPGIMIGGLAGTQIVRIVSLALVYKYRKDRKPCVIKCRTLENNQIRTKKSKKMCLAQCNINSINEVIRYLQSEGPKCHSTKKPEKCTKHIASFIKQYEGKRLKYIKQLKKAQSMK